MDKQPAVDNMTSFLHALHASCIQKLHVSWITSKTSKSQVVYSTWTITEADGNLATILCKFTSPSSTNCWMLLIPTLLRNLTRSLLMHGSISNGESRSNHSPWNNNISMNIRGRNRTTNLNLEKQHFLGGPLIQWNIIVQNYNKR